jgi:hypothetical protein
MPHGKADNDHSFLKFRRSFSAYRSAAIEAAGLAGVALIDKNDSAIE